MVHQTEPSLLCQITCGDVIVTSPHGKLLTDGNFAGVLGKFPYGVSSTRDNSNHVIEQLSVG